MFGWKGKESLTQDAVYCLPKKEVKIDKEHVKGSTTMNPTEMATIEPITAATILEPSDIKVTKTSPGGARDERL